MSEPFHLKSFAEISEALDAMAIALLSVEFVPVGDSGEGDGACPACGWSEWRPVGYVGAWHRETCRVDIGLTKAGFPDQASRDAARKKLGL